MLEREIPVLYKRKEECCGCTACYAICPKEAISMVEDEEGFEYPQIDENKCVRCHQCIKVCPIKAFTELNGGTCSPKILRSAMPSDASLPGVPVPCTLI